MGHKCCFCIKLKHGTAIIDLVTVLQGILIVLIGGFFSDVSDVCEDFQEILENNGVGEEENDVSRFAVETCEDTIEPLLLTISMALIITGALAIVSALLHLAGIYTKIVVLMVPMVIWLGMAMGTAISISVAFFVIGALMPSGTGIESVCYVLGGTFLVEALIICYFIYVFVKYRKEVKSSSKPPIPPNTPDHCTASYPHSSYPATSQSTKEAPSSYAGFSQQPHLQPGLPTYLQPVHSYPGSSQPVYSKPMYHPQSSGNVSPSAPAYNQPPQNFQMYPNLGRAQGSQHRRMTPFGSH